MQRIASILRVSFLAWVACLLCGCGNTSTGGLDLGGHEGGAVVELIDDLAEANPTTFKHSFATGSIPSPATQKKMSAYGVRVVETPRVEGTTATVRVKFNKRPHGEEAGEKEWTLVKEGEKWKIKSAPTP